MIAKILLVALMVALSDGAVLQFSGRNLPYMDIGNGYADAFIDVFYARTLSAPYELLGTTDDIGNTTNPDWSDTFDVVYTFGSTQMFKIEMWDADSPDADDYMGYIEFMYSDIINDSDGILIKNLIGGEKDQGQVLIKRLSM